MIYDHFVKNHHEKQKTLLFRVMLRFFDPNNICEFFASDGVILQNDVNHIPWIKPLLSIL